MSFLRMNHFNLFSIKTPKRDINKTYVLSNLSDSRSQGLISPYKFLVPCLPVRVKFTN